MRYQLLLWSDCDTGRDEKEVGETDSIETVNEHLAKEMDSEGWFPSAWDTQTESYFYP